MKRQREGAERDSAAVELLQLYSIMKQAALRKDIAQIHCAKTWTEHVWKLEIEKQFQIVEPKHHHQSKSIATVNLPAENW